MRFWLVFCAILLFANNSLAADVALEPSQIYDEILNSSNYEITEYNYPSGTRELNLFGLSNIGQYNLNAVAAPDFENLVYSEVYFYPDPRITASAIYLIPLEANLSKKEAILSVSTKDKLQLPIAETNYSQLRPFKFNTFTPVDWNKNSDKILFKEKLGMNYDQIYLTKLFLYDMSTEKLYDLNLLRTKIIEYWEKRNLYLPDYRWDIFPLGFLKEDETKIVSHAYGYNGKERKFLGVWIVDYTGDNVLFYSLEKEQTPEVSSNGKCLKFIPDMGDIYKKQREIDAKTKQRYIEPK